jgi:hypothetical protein
MNKINYQSRKILINNMLNNSKSKQMFSFGKAKRFNLRTECLSNSFYNIPSTLSKRGTSFGYGHKTDITLMDNFSDKFKINPPLYELSKIKDSSHKNSPKFSFGSKNYNLKGINKFITPGPNYEIREVFGKGRPKYSFHIRNEYKGDNFISPGPGCYESVGLSGDGKYFSSKTRNISTSNWSKSKTPRFAKIRAATDLSYNVGDLMSGNGKCFNSKYSSSPAKSMGLKLTSIFDTYEKKNYPGPGEYETYSEFNNYHSNNLKTQPNFYNKRNNYDLYSNYNTYNIKELPAIHNNSFYRKYNIDNNIHIGKNKNPHHITGNKEMHFLIK